MQWMKHCIKVRLWSGNSRKRPVPRPRKSRSQGYAFSCLRVWLKREREREGGGGGGREREVGGWWALQFSSNSKFFTSISLRVHSLRNTLPMKNNALLHCSNHRARSHAGTFLFYSSSRSLSVFSFFHFLFSPLSVATWALNAAVTTALTGCSWTRSPVLNQGMLPLPSTVVDLTTLNIAVMMQTVFSRMSTGTCGGSGKCNFHFLLHFFCFLP